MRSNIEEVDYYSEIRKIFYNARQEILNTIETVERNYKYTSRMHKGFILLFETEEQALSFEAKINYIIDTANEKIIKLDPEEKLLSYSMHKHHANGRICLSTKEASMRKKITGAAIKKSFKSTKKRKVIKVSVNGTDIPDENIDLDAMFPNERNFSVHKASGESYRLSFYDAELNKRETVSLNAIAIFYGDNLELEDAPRRKQRSDKKEYYAWIDTEIMGGEGETICEHMTVYGNAI